jgi:hypothetical protein
MDLNDVLLGYVYSLCHGGCDIGAFGDTDADLAFMVTQYHQGAEPETAAAADYAGYPVNMDYPFIELLLVHLSVDCRVMSATMVCHLELQSSGSRRVS